MKNTSRRNFLKTAGVGALAAAGSVSSKAISAPAISSGKKRIMVGSFSDETNTFIPRKRTLEEAKRSARFGDDAIRRSGGFADICEMFDVELLGSVRVGGNHCLMEEDVFDYVAGSMIDTLDKHQVDAVFLALHGGGCTEGHDDLEGELLEIIRKKVGPDIPVMFTMDLHCQVTPLMTQAADAVSIYRTYPHVDGYKCGLEVGGVTLLINSQRIGPNSQRNLRAIGIYPENYQMTVCKGGFAFRPVYPSTTFNYIVCETPGYSSTKLDTFTWKRIPRPMYPLDDI